MCSKTGISGHNISDILWNNYGIACEMADKNNIVFIITSMHTYDDLSLLCNALSDISSGMCNPHVYKTIPYPYP